MWPCRCARARRGRPDAARSRASVLLQGRAPDPDDDRAVVADGVTATPIAATTSLQGRLRSRRCRPAERGERHRTRRRCGSTRACDRASPGGLAARERLPARAWERRGLRWDRALGASVRRCARRGLAGGRHASGTPIGPVSTQRQGLAGGAFRGGAREGQQRHRSEAGHRPDGSRRPNGGCGGVRKK